MKATVTGVGGITAKLNQTIEGIKGRSVDGQFELGERILELAKRRVPVEYGELQESGFVVRRTAEHHGVVVGFRAKYAVFVHENMEAKLRGRPRPSGIGVYWGPRGQPKFLESAIQEMTPQALKIVQKHAKVR